MTAMPSDDDSETSRHPLAYSPSQLAQLLGCTRQHVHNMLKRGELRSVKFGAKRLIPHAAVAELLSGGHTEPAATRDTAS